MMNDLSLEGINTGIALRENVEFETVFEHFIPIKPETKERARVFRGRGIDTPRNRKFKRDVRTYLNAKYKGKSCDGPIEMLAVFFLKKPKSVKRKNHSVKPDLDNLAKALLDAISNDKTYKSGLITNDSRIYRLHLEKHYSQHEGILLKIDSPARKN